MQKTTEDTVAAKHYKVWGAASAGLGGGLIIAALKNQNRSGGCIGLGSRYDYICSGSETANWGLLAPAIGAVGGGAFLVAWGLHKSTKANEDLHRLRQYGLDKGWQVQLGTTFRIAYRW